jgi:Protein of unknown function (DUF2934)
MPHFCGRTHTNRRYPSPTLSRLMPKTATTGGRATPAHQEIAALAYAYWEARGRPWGSPGEDWFRAERELVREKNGQA